jgi:pimeloyl-ACP methyl ester carboxylesterase
MAPPPASSSPPPTPEAVPRRFRTTGGVELVADTWGDEEDPTVLLAHGGGQTRHSWGGTASVLARHGWYAVSIDLRGHGQSGWSADGDYRFGRFAEDVADVAQQLDRPAMVGASLGGLTGLLVEGRVSGTFRSLVLVDITPRMEPEGVERIMTFMGETMDRGFGSLEEAADIVAAYNPHRPRTNDARGLAKNLRLDEDGRWRWHWDPAFLTGMGEDPDSPLEDEFHGAARRISLPTLLVRGRLSDLVSDETAREFLADAPHAEYVDVSDAGHMVAGDRNDAFTSAVVDFLGRHP